MGFVGAICVGALVGYTVGVIIERRNSSLKKSNPISRKAGVRQQLARKSNHVRHRTWSNK